MTAATSVRLACLVDPAVHTCTPVAGDGHLTRPTTKGEYP